MTAHAVWFVPWLHYKLGILRNNTEVGIGFFPLRKAHVFHGKLSQYRATGFDGALRAGRGWCGVEVLEPQAALLAETSHSQHDHLHSHSYLELQLQSSG